MSSPPLEEIQQLARKVIEVEGLELVDLEFKAGKWRNLLRIFIDKDGGVTLADCENISRQVGTLLDVKDLVRNAYVLEVSSPGLDRPFKTDRDYERALGKMVKVHLLDEKRHDTHLVGKLLEVGEQEIVIEESGELRRITRPDIKRVHQETLFPVHPKRKQRKRRK